MKQIKMKLKEILIDKNITQKELAQKTNIREATISEIVRGTKTVINFSHLTAIAIALDIERISDIIYIEKDDTE